jgi:hypothetical protein
MNDRHLESNEFIFNIKSSMYVFIEYQRLIIVQFIASSLRQLTKQA